MLKEAAATILNTTSFWRCGGGNACDACGLKIKTESNNKKGKHGVAGFDMFLSQQVPVLAAMPSLPTGKPEIVVQLPITSEEQLKLEFPHSFESDLGREEQGEPAFERSASGGAATALAMPGEKLGPLNFSPRHPPPHRALRSHPDFPTQDYQCSFSFCQPTLHPPRLFTRIIE